MKTNDDLEIDIAKILNKLDIKFIHESEIVGQRLDFYLPDFDIYIEVKKFYSERSNSQLSSQENIIFIQGRKSLNFLENILTNQK